MQLHAAGVTALGMTSARSFGAGDIMTMPGLPKVPSATNIRMNANGHIEGLF